MELSSRRALITACSGSFSFDVTRSWSPCIRTTTFVDTCLAFFCRDRASSSEIPALSATSMRPRPLPTVFGSPALNSLAERCRRAAFSSSTWKTARARSSVEASIRIEPSLRSILGSVPLKSKRVPTSRRAWSSALVSSCASYCETTSNENSCANASLTQDAAQPGDEGGDAQPDDQQCGGSEQECDAD